LCTYKGPDEPTEDNFICTPPGEPSTKKWTDCEEEGPSCPFESSECMPQLICNAETKECSLPTGVLDRLTQECMYKKSLFRLGLFHWDPQCNPDGSYAPKQCKGEYGVDGICFCVDTEGRRIFGREWRALAENQTCGQLFIKLNFSIKSSLMLTWKSYLQHAVDKQVSLELQVNCPLSIVPTTGTTSPSNVTPTLGYATV